ncbi:MAG: transglutaminase family protein [Gemmatimonadaceae bacterium]
MNRRGVAAGAILVAWIAGLGLLVRREYFRPQVERLAEAGMRVTPGPTYYAVLQGGRHIGFASTSVDTGANSITVNDYLIADLPVGGRTHRATARTAVNLSRGFRVRDFAFELTAGAGPISATGRVDGDSVVRLIVRAGSARPDTQRIPVTGPVLLPTLIPLVVGLGGTPEVGQKMTLPVLDPVAMAASPLSLTIDAETLFVVHDSATLDAPTSRWRGLLPDTVRAWHVVPAGSTTFQPAWVDQQGRVVESTQFGRLTLRRMPYELAFENWRRETRRGGPVTNERDILETTAIAANKRVTRHLERLRVRLRNVDLAGYDLDGGRQSLRGDTLTITRESLRELRPYRLSSADRSRFPRETSPETLIESREPELAFRAAEVAGSDRAALVVAERLNAWVHRSLAKRITVGIPSALQVLRARRGDCNEHTQLYVAMARAVGLPARIATGLAYLDGKFYYHAWPEVFVGEWIAVDPTLGQFPADAAHLRFAIGGLGRQIELLRLIGNLEIDVIDQ